MTVRINSAGDSNVEAGDHSAGTAAVVRPSSSTNAHSWEAIPRRRLALTICARAGIRPDPTVAQGLGMS